MQISTSTNILNIISWNVQGLRSPNKRLRILRHLKRLKADVALLHKNCKYKSTNEEIDETGRRLTIQLTPVGTQGDTDIDLLITNIYAPNSPTTTYSSSCEVG